MQVIPIVVCLIVFTISDGSEINKTSISISQTETSHRKLPLFPRMNIKFLINSHRISKNANVNQDITVKKPLMPKMIPKTKIEVNISKTVTATRKPLMKLKNFVVKTITNRRHHKSDDDQNSTKENYGVIINNTVTEATSNDLRLPKKNIFFAREKTTDNRLPKDVVATTVNYFAEEHKDRKEFIFLDSKVDEKVTDHDLLQMDEKDLETTTAKVDIKENLRSKRSVNIIEEENRVTAFPIRKYTDHDVKLSNDRFFKNVNT